MEKFTDGSVSVNIEITQPLVYLEPQFIIPLLVQKITKNFGLTFFVGLYCACWTTRRQKCRKHKTRILPVQNRSGRSSSRHVHPT